MKKCTTQFIKMVWTQAVSDWCHAHPQVSQPRALLASCAIFKHASGLLYVPIKRATHTLSMKKTTVDRCIVKLSAVAALTTDGISACSKGPFPFGGMADGTLHEPSARKVMFHYCPFIDLSLKKEPRNCILLQDVPTTVNMEKYWKKYKVLPNWSYSKPLSRHILLNNHIRSFTHWTVSSACEVMLRYYPFTDHNLLKKPYFCTILQDLPATIHLQKHWKSYNRVLYFWAYPKSLPVHYLWNNHIRSFNYIHWTGPSTPADFLSVNCLHHQCIRHCCTSHKNRGSKHSAIHINNNNYHDWPEVNSQNFLGLLYNGQGTDNLHMVNVPKIPYFVLFMASEYLFHCSTRIVQLHHDHDNTPSRLWTTTWHSTILAFALFLLSTMATLSVFCCHCSTCFTLLLLHRDCENALGYWNWWIHALTCGINSAIYAVQLFCQSIATVDSFTVNCYHHSTCSILESNHPGSYLNQSKVDCLLVTIITVALFFSLQTNWKSDTLCTNLTQWAVQVLYILQNQCKNLIHCINTIALDVLALFHSNHFYIYCVVSFQCRLQIHAVTFQLQEQLLSATVYSILESVSNGFLLCSTLVAPIIGKIIRYLYAYKLY